MDDASYKRLLGHERIVKDLLIGFIAPRSAAPESANVGGGSRAERARRDVAREPELTRTFDLWLGAMGRKLGVILPSIREYEEANAVLANTIDRWEAEILQRGIEQGIEQEKALLRRLAERRFGAAAAEQLAAALAGVTDPDRLAEAGDWIVDSATTDDFLSRLGGAGS